MDNAFPTFELDKHNVLIFSFGKDQYTRFTNKKIATYPGQSFAQLRSYFEGWTADMPVFQKAMSSIVTRLDPETQLKASMGFESLHFQL